MPDAPKTDMEKIHRIHRSLQRQYGVYQNERFHRMAIGLLALVGFIGWVFFGHLKFLLIIAVIYFIVAVARGNIKFGGRRHRRRRSRQEELPDGG
jgi:Flp pilus assembly protein TadB